MQENARVTSHFFDKSLSVTGHSRSCLCHDTNGDLDRTMVRHLPVTDLQANPGQTCRGSIVHLDCCAPVRCTSPTGVSRYSRRHYPRKFNSFDDILQPCIGNERVVYQAWACDIRALLLSALTDYRKCLHFDSFQHLVIRNIGYS